MSVDDPQAPDYNGNKDTSSRPDKLYDLKVHGEVLPPTLYPLKQIGAAPLRSDGKVPLRSGAPGLRFQPRVGVFYMTIFDRGR